MPAVALTTFVPGQGRRTLAVISYIQARHLARRLNELVDAEDARTGVER